MTTSAGVREALLDKVKCKQDQNDKKPDTKMKGKSFLCRGDRNNSQVRMHWGIGGIWLEAYWGPGEW